MDWARAKTVLILAFLCLNVFLGYRLWWGQLPVDETAARALSGDELRQAVAELAAVGVLVETPLPARIPSLARLVASSELDPGRTAARFFGPSLPPEQEDTGSEITWETADLRLTLFPTGRTLLERHPFAPAEAPELDGRGVWDQLRARRVAQAFLEDYAYAPPHLTVDAVVYDPEVAAYKVTFMQAYEGWIVFDAVTTVTVGHWGVLAVDQMALELGPFVGDRRTLLHAAAALQSMAAALEPSDVPLYVIQLSLGYRRTGEADAVPVWRIVAADGRQIYVSAETGRIIE